MKVHPICHLALLLSILLPSCRERVAPETQSENVRFAPVVGESWTYEVTVRLSPGAQLPEGSAQAGPEGSVTKSHKIRRYVGEQVPEENFTKAHTFEVYQEGELSETEFSLFTPEGIFTSGSRKEGQAALLLDPPVLLVPENLPLSAVWDLALPNPNDPSGPPMIQRKFQYRGLEPLQVMGEKKMAHHVKVVGTTGPVQLQRDFWFVNSIGFVKERRGYYANGKRLALMEEVLIEHEIPR